MSMAASPRKPWETGPSPTGSTLPVTTTSTPAATSAPAVPFSSTYDPTGASASSTSSTAAPDAHALVAAHNNRLSTTTTSPSTALTPTNLPYDPSAQPVLPAPNPYGITPSALYQPGMLPMPGMPGMYPGQPGLPGMPPVGFNPITHIGSSIQSFGRFSQLLQLNFDALHMSFSSLLRLFDFVFDIEGGDGYAGTDVHYAQCVCVAGWESVAADGAAAWERWRVGYGEGMDGGGRCEWYGWRGWGGRCWWCRRKGFTIVFFGVDVGVVGDCSGLECCALDHTHCSTSHSRSR